MDCWGKAADHRGSGLSGTGPCTRARPGNPGQTADESVCMYLHLLKGELLQSFHGHAMEGVSPSRDAGASSFSQPLEIDAFFFYSFPAPWPVAVISSPSTSSYLGNPTYLKISLHQQSPYISLKIYISLDAFFQVNTAGTEMLYQTMGDLSRVNSNSILFDICCETGKWPPRAQSVCCLAPKPCPPNTHGPCSQCWKMMVVV